LTAAAGYADRDGPVRPGGALVEVKIGVQYASRELVLESGQTPDQVEQAVAKAIGAEAGVLSLMDEKGRRVIVPAAKLAYVEIAEVESRRVGFGTM
jgi:3-hydroxyacyl-CoA dehydrogenase